MGLAENFWKDRQENYADGFTKTFTASTAENVLGIDIARPVIVYSVAFTVSQNNASGELALVDGSATADSGDTRKARWRVASGGTTERDLGGLSNTFPRGMIFQTGLIVSAATLTGDVTITYRPR